MSCGKFDGMWGCNFTCYKYDLKVVIPLFMVTCFETLNSIVEASMFVGCGDELKYEVNMFKVATSFEESS
jgi:hypothetical protein